MVPHDYDSYQGGMMTLRRPMIKDKKAAVLLGGGLFLLGSWFLFDAWERRGQRTPRLARPFVWF